MPKISFFARELGNYRIGVVFFATAIVLMSGCAHVRKSADSSKDSADIRSPRTVSEVISQSDLPEQKTAQPSPVVKIAANSGGEIVVQGQKMKNTQFDLPITINSRVDYWVDYFTGRGRKHFAKYLERSEFFIPYIRPILQQAGMPEDLVYLAMVESGFNNLARSHARAVGPWQFISATGKRYGLMVNWWVDERRDIRKSTLAAVEYLRELYQMFGSWELAAAAYNAGEGKIARAVQRYGSKDFWTIANHRFLRQETRDYVPKIIAAAIVAKNRVQFGFPASNVLHVGADEAVASDGEVVKVEKSDRPEEKVSGGDQVGDLIAHSSKAADESDLDADDEDDEAPVPSVTPATLLVPMENGLPEGQQASNTTSSGDASMPLAKPVPKPYVTKKGEVGGAEISEFDVKSPADLLKVARAAGLSYQTVKSLNPELLRWVTPPNVGSYRIRLPASVKEKFLATYNHAAYPRQVKFMTYKIRRGETLTHVARHFGIKVDPISDLNGVSPKRSLRAGLSVVLPIPNDRSRSLASLEVRDPPEKHRRRGRRRSRYTKITYKKREAARDRSG